jgi:hypothetical protein
MMARILRCNIEDLAKWHPWFFLEPQVVACVAVLGHYGVAPAVLDVECLNVDSAWLGEIKDFRLEISWLSETADKAKRLRATVQTKPLVEMAATALALVLSHQVVRLGQLDVTSYGDRTDFRSTQISCMLEVSGTQTPRELDRRHRQKVQQALRNPLRWDAYVVVCAFSSRGHRIRLSFQRPNTRLKMMGESPPRRRGLCPPIPDFSSLFRRCFLSSGEGTGQ